MLTYLVKYRVCYRNVCGACSQEVRQELRQESGHEAREKQLRRRIDGFVPRPLPDFILQLWRKQTMQMLIME